MLALDTWFSFCTCITAIHSTLQLDSQRYMNNVYSSLNSTTPCWQIGGETQVYMKIHATTLTNGLTQHSSKSPHVNSTTGTTNHLAHSKEKMKLYPMQNYSYVHITGVHVCVEHKNSCGGMIWIISPYMQEAPSVILRLCSDSVILLCQWYIGEICICTCMVETGAWSWILHDTNSRAVTGQMLRQHIVHSSNITSMWS